MEKAIAEIVREETRFPVPSVILKYYNASTPQLTDSYSGMAADSRARQYLSDIMFVLESVIRPTTDEESVLMQRMRAVCAACQTAPIWIEFRSMGQHDQTKYVIRWWREMGVKQLLIDKVDRAVTEFFSTKPGGSVYVEPQTEKGTNDLVTVNSTSEVSVKQPPPVESRGCSAGGVNEGDQ